MFWSKPDKNQYYQLTDIHRSGQIYIYSHDDKIKILECKGDPWLKKYIDETCYIRNEKMYYPKETIMLYTGEVIAKPNVKFIEDKNKEVVLRRLLPVEIEALKLKNL